MSRYRLAPDVVTLPAKAASAAVGKPPVRIFLGTEDGQWRAERIFFYSIEQVRDPGRDYEIHLMKNLDGFDRDDWRTGFTNYRFAIPTFAGLSGRAIYNDVDQIYLTDPARLFDTDMGDHGYLSVSAEDTSVMLMDCATMSRWWTRETAIRHRKAELIREPAAEPGTWGKLADGWNARDMEYVAGESGLVHFTALHLQPWQPSHDQYSYHLHPLARVWLDLERRADAEGYQVFGPDRPSPRFEPDQAPRDTPDFPGLAAPLRAYLASVPGRRILAPVPSAGQPAPVLAAMADIDVTTCRIDRVADQPGAFDVVVSAGVLEQYPAEDVPWLLEGLFARAPAVYLAVQCGDPAGTEADVDVARCFRPARWWRQQLEAAARRRPHVAWLLHTRGRDGQARTVWAEGLGDRPPSVWVLEGARAGDNAQADCLARALGWPCQRKKLAFNRLHYVPNFLLGKTRAHLRRGASDALHPPWPDVVLAIGKRSSGVARWIKAAAGGQPRLVHLGRPWARLDDFDLIVTTPQYRLPARDNVVHNDLPLTRVSAASLARRRSEIADQFDDLPRPRIAVLVGGSSWSYAFGPATGRRLGETCSRRARETGGSLLIITSSRTGRRTADAVAGALDAPCRLHRYRKDGRANPYLDYLAVADEVLVTSESASMIADAIATRKPVRLFHPPARLPSRVSAVVRTAIDRLRGTTYRGTPRQQGPLARLYDALVARGIVTPSRDLGRLHELVEGPGFDADRDELAETVERIAALFNRGREIPGPGG